MAANAPYYQMRTGQFTNATDNTNAAQAQFGPDDDDYGLSTPAAVTSAHEQLHPSMYPEHASQQTSADNTFEENHNFVELLEAATTAAAGQAAQASIMTESTMASTAAQSRSMRKRGSTSPISDAAAAEDHFGSKRRRVNMLTDPRLQDGDHNVRGSPDFGSVLPSSESLLNGARAAGVHSAAALFRHSSERTSRKYTRPPMSKLFMSLQLSPENFLQLQAQAKTYMLDTTHPERQNCVGNRGKGDTDMVKLRLFNCVRDFLNDKVGEQFFGEHVEKPGEREAFEAARALGEEKISGTQGRLMWPRDGNKIIGLVTPLMRRMVTNERQRQYAIETRKGGSKKGKDGSVEVPSPQPTSHHDAEQQSQLSLDPSLAQQLQTTQPTSPTPVAVMLSSPTGYQSHQRDHVTASISRTEASDAASIKLLTAASTEPNLSHINVLVVTASQGTRSGIKLDEKRVSAEHPAHLAFYDWNGFLKDVQALISRIRIKYPELRHQLAVKENNIGADSLRGLAAAANALQFEDTKHNTATPHVDSVMKDCFQKRNETPSTRDVNSMCKSSTTSPDTALAGKLDYSSVVSAPSISDTPMADAQGDAAGDVLPEYIIKTIGPLGWQIIRNEQDWYNVLREKAFAVWADGVCNVLVELCNVKALGPGHRHE